MDENKFTMRLEALREAMKLAIQCNDNRAATEVLKDARKFAKFILNE